MVNIYKYDEQNRLIGEGKIITVNAAKENMEGFRGLRHPEVE